MSNYKLIAFDMDGTLLDSQKRIREDSIEAMHEAVRAGKLVVLSTGRAECELKEYERELREISYVISTSGALVFECSTGREIFSSHIPEAQVRALLKAAEDLDVLQLMMNRNTFMSRDKLEHLDRYHMGQYRKLYDGCTTAVDDVRAYYESAPFPVCKLNNFCLSTQQRLEMEKRVRPLGLQLQFAEETSLECSPTGISKGTALLKLCEAVGITAEEAIAVGDADNDIDILRTAGLGIAMGNANERVKAVADVVVADCDHGGCAEAIRRFLM